MSALAMLLDFSPVGIAALVLLSQLVREHPSKAMAVWGAVYVPVTALWTVPALSGPIAMLGAIAGYALCGVIFYGGSSVLASRVLCRYPILILGCSLGLAEATSAALALVMAPIGLFAVQGFLGSLIAGFSVVGASVIIGVVVSIAGVFLRNLALPMTMALVYLLCLIPGPHLPSYDGPPVHGISHSPDAELKWTSHAHAADNFSRLQSLSEAVAGNGLIVWPEGAVTETFSLKKAVSKLEPDHLPLLFGMTRYANTRAPDLRNSAVLVTKNGVQVTDKKRLVPFYEGAVPFLFETDLEPGTRRVLVLPDGTKILPLICYEVFMPRTWFLKRLDADLILVMSAETGFPRGVSASIMKRHVRARELETGVRVVWVSDRSSETD
ncbi:MAG: nitrilase-related carbon-nitrogen hydrolase [Paracoccaceae bacterium]|nr:nitrilase-related carbon-nitrogen hydrolase [Paracoccaceae bacterium]